jgi:hypothetical protein
MQNAAIRAAQGFDLNIAADLLATLSVLKTSCPISTHNKLCLFIGVVGGDGLRVVTR